MSMWVAMISAVSIVTALAMISVFRPPEWLDRNERMEGSWLPLNIASSVVALLSSLGSTWALSHLTDDMLALTTMSVSSAALVFLTIQTTITDMSVRMADRRILNLASLVTGGLGLATLLTIGNESILVTYGMFALLAIAVIFLPIIGPSDGRALLLVVLSSIPNIGLAGFITPMYGIFALVMIYGIVVAVKSKRISTLWKSKISLPLVPMILAPYAIAVIIAPALLTL